MAKPVTRRSEEDRPIYLCAVCGGVMNIAIREQKLECPYCGLLEPKADELKTTERNAYNNLIKKETDLLWDTDKQTYRCNDCSFSAISDPKTAAQSCTYCESKQIASDSQNVGVKPKSLLTFTLNKNDAQTLWSQSIKQKWYSVSHTNPIYRYDKMVPLYVPYWQYTTKTCTKYAGHAGEHYYENIWKRGKIKRVRRTRHTSVSGLINRTFYHTYVNASGRFTDTVMEHVEPYNTAELIPYHPQLLEATFVERYDKDASTCFEVAKNRIKNTLLSDVQKQVLMQYDEVRDIELEPHFTDVEYHLVLMPIWTVKYRCYRRNYRTVINGQTGKIHGHYPISPFKVGFVLLIMLVLAAALFFLFSQTI